MNKQNSKKGISLVALIITIIVLIILTGAVIVTFMKDGIIDKSREAVLKNDLTTFREQLRDKVLEEQLNNSELNKQNINAEYKSTNTLEMSKTDQEDIRYWIPSITEKYIDKIEIQKGELLFIGEDEKEILVATELLINIKSDATQIFNMIGTWNINCPSDGSTYTGIITVTGQTENSFTGTIEIDVGDINNITNGQILGTTVSFTRIFQQTYRQDYTGILDVSSGTPTIIGSFTGSGPMTFKMTKSI